MLLKKILGNCALAVTVLIGAGASAAAPIRIDLGEATLHPWLAAALAAPSPPWTPPSNLRAARQTSAVQMNPDGRRLPRVRVASTEFALARPSAPPRLSALFLHSGGFVFGASDVSAGLIDALASALRACVFAFDYPLAPEHRLPATTQATAQAWRLLTQHDDPSGCPRATLVIGESAGGTLAALLTDALRGSSQAPAAQLLLYPMLDARATAASWRRYARNPLLPAAQGRWLWAQALGPDGDREAYSPLRAARFDRLPRTVVVVAQVDVLHDEGVRYAERVAAAGGAVTLLTARGLPHGYLSAPSLFPDAIKQTLTALSRALDASVQ
jgi:acetyl esterase